MKKIHILGTGCPKCKKLTENAEEAVRESSGEYEVIKVTEINKIMEYGVMMTPSLVLEGEVKSTGRLLTVDEIKELLKNN
jgi:small redox-active disulfide protein 2